MRPLDGFQAQRFAVMPAMNLFSARGTAMNLNQKVAARAQPLFFFSRPVIESLKPKLQSHSKASAPAPDPSGLQLPPLIPCRHPRRPGSLTTDHRPLLFRALCLPTYWGIVQESAASVSGQPQNPGRTPLAYTLTSRCSLAIEQYTSPKIQKVNKSSPRCRLAWRGNVQDPVTPRGRP